MVSRDAHLSDKPKKKCMKMPIRKVRIGGAVMENEGGLWRAGQVLVLEVGGDAVTRYLPSKDVCFVVFSEFVFLIELKEKCESILNTGEFLPTLDGKTCYDSISRGNKRKDIEVFKHSHGKKHHR